MLQAMPLDNFHSHDRPRVPGAHKWMMALAVVLLLGASAFFELGEPSSYVYGVVLVFALVALGLPWTLWRIRRNHPEAAAMSADAASRQEDESLGEAVIPMAAVSLGMVALAIALHVAAG